METVVWWTSKSTHKTDSQPPATRIWTEDHYYLYRIHLLQQLLDRAMDYSYFSPVEDETLLDACSICYQTDNAVNCRVEHDLGVGQRCERQHVLCFPCIANWMYDCTVLRQNSHSTCPFCRVTFDESKLYILLLTQNCRTIPTRDRIHSSKWVL